MNIASFFPDGNLCLTATSNQISLWDVNNGNLIHTINTPDEWKSMTSLDISMDGTKLAVGCWDEIIHVIDLLTERVLYDIKGHTAPVQSVKFITDNQILSGAGEYGDGIARIWDLRNVIGSWVYE
ncbi:MAG: WD40 repeat domain-containing protein [bacterium]|jgi:WD40 repeat protein